MTVSCSHKTRKLGIKRVTVFACQSSDNWSFVDQFHVLFFSLTFFYISNAPLSFCNAIGGLFCAVGSVFPQKPSAELYVTLCKKLLRTKRIATETRIPKAVLSRNLSW